MTFGTHIDGRHLLYDELIYEFSLEKEPITLQELRTMDARGQIHWNLLEQRDWFYRIDGKAFDEANRRACERYRSDTEDLEEQIRRHVKADNSYIHGRIVKDEPPVPPKQGAVAAQDGASASGGTSASGTRPSPEKGQTRAAGASSSAQANRMAEEAAASAPHPGEKEKLPTAGQAQQKGIKGKLFKNAARISKQGRR